LKPGDDIQIRLASADDAAAVQSLIVDLAETVGGSDRVKSTVEDFHNALSGAEPDIYALMLEQDQVPVGLAVFFLTFSTWRGKRGAYLQDIYLQPGLRGTGAGKRLLAQVAAWAIDKGADHLRLSVDSDNKSAQAFYESIGMKLCEEERVYQISDDDLVQLGSFE
jgi:ribosomal protein S18 acetylase RimI-like enzyme